MTAANKGVRTQHPDYAAYAAKWKRCRDAIAGQDAVHGAGEAYLKKLTDQTVDDYAAYKQRASFFNASWRTIQGFQGMLYRKDPTLKVPAKVEGYLADVTMAGQSFLSFAKAVSYETLAVGRVGVLVDHPPAGNVESLTLDIAAKLGLRPTMQAYAAESIINWSYSRVDNQHTLTLLVLKEVVREPSPDSEFETVAVEQYRVLDLISNEQGQWTYRQRVFRIEDGKDVQFGADVIPLMDNKPLARIPFKCIGPDGEEMSLDDPPLIDLIDLNLSHYRTTADYEHGCHFTGLPMLFLAGVDPGEGKIMIGSQAAIVAPAPEARGMFIEFTGQGLTALENALDRKERQMAVLGARMLSDEKSQVETLGATAIKRTGENSALSSVAISVSEALQAQLKLFSQWAGADGEVVFEINREFLPAQIDAQTLTALMAAWQGGGISEAELFELLKRGDVIDGEKTLEEHQAETEIAAPPAPAKPKVEEAA